MASPPPSTMSDGNGKTHIQVVHTPGITRVLFAPKAAGVDRLFTAGDDYLVRLLPTAHNSTEEALLIDDSSGPVTWIDAGSEHLVVASEDGSVRLYKHRGDESGTGYGAEVDSPTQIYGVLTRTSLPTRCVALERAISSGKSPRAAICSDELIVKVVDVEDTKRVNLLTGHSRAVRAASWSPIDATLVTSSCDGTARVWDCKTAEPGCTKVIEGLPTTRPEDETDVHAEWHPSGEFFVLPSKTNDLVIYSAGDAGYVKTGVFTPPARGTSTINPPTGAVTALSFCPNGRYLATATTDGQVTVWETSSRAPIRAQRAESNVTGLSWHPNADTLAWVDTSGQLIRWLDVVGAQYPSPSEPVAFGSRQRRNQEVDDLFAGTGIDDMDEDDAGGEMAGHDGDDDGLDDFVVDDDGNGAQYSKAAAAERASNKRRRSRLPASSSALAPTTKPQPTFQPNSTPMRNSRRFLSLSLFGSLVSIDQDTHHVVSFESFDSAARRNWKMVDHFGYSMASVGATGALLACPQKDDSPSALHFKPFEAAGAWSAPGAEWGVELPLGEQVTAVAMGGAPPRRPGADDDDDAQGAIAKTASALSATAVVATSSGYLRFFSSSGLQRYVWAFSSQVVAMAAGKQHVIVVHHSGAHDGYQNLSYSLIDLISFEVRQTGTLPLGRDVQLRWVGFNELDIAAVYDSRGVMYLLDRAFAAPGQARWVPVLESAAVTDAGKSAEDATSSRVQFWPLSMSSTQLFCVFVRGAVQFPDPSASGHPLIQEVDLKLPLLGASSTMEEKHLRQTLLASSIRSAFASLVVPPTEYASDVPDPTALIHDADKELLQLIQQACKDDKHARALDAARELHNGRMLDAALQIASFFHLPSLADRLSTLRDWVETRSERDERLELEGPSGVDSEEYSSHSERARRREEPTRGVSTASARKALTEGFEGVASTPRRSQVTRRADDAFGLSSATPAPASAPLREAPPNRKRSLDENEDNEDTDTQRMPAPAASASKQPRGNPFARQPGMTRDRSMHKSNSFFDRAEADLTQPRAKKTKQSTLLGLRKSSTPAARPAFGETQSESQVDDAEDVRATLDSVAQRESRREQTGGLEETQFVPLGLEESQVESQEMEVGHGSGASKLEAFRRRAGESQGSEAQSQQSQSQSIQV